MSVERLYPDLHFLREEYLLIQAWKKASNFIRSHSWYADTLELDRTTINLPTFLEDLSEGLREIGSYRRSALRIVPAPKNHPWRVDPKSKRWEPVPLPRKRENIGRSPIKLRPLAHISMRDQVVATAAMLCLADLVELLQGDPRSSIKEESDRAKILSYGNRLFCGDDGFHRWGSAKLYRAYSQDYRKFLTRPEVAAEQAISGKTSTQKVVIVQSDLKQFYDRVSPKLLADKVRRLPCVESARPFLDFVGGLFNWEWAPQDRAEAARYAKQSGLESFEQIALPQGLVASGFFSNVVMLDFDRGIRNQWNQEIAAGMVLKDYCRYVDDMRIVLLVNENENLATIEKKVVVWLQTALNKSAPGLLVADGEKTVASEFEGDNRPLVRQSRRMERIQAAISGGFDVGGGEEILDAIEGLVRGQARFTSKRLAEDGGWEMSPVPDVRDETVARFAAARYRRTYRSLRPMLLNREESQRRVEEDEEKQNGNPRPPRSKEDLDDDTRTFALGLVEQWVNDPSNVRLLRIGLDLWPDAVLLDRILELIKPFTERSNRRGAARRVALYGLAELFRAGATETGIVDNPDEQLPSEIDLEKYRERLDREARHLLSKDAAILPWYLKQQVMLYLATRTAPIDRLPRGNDVRNYHRLIRFIRRENRDLSIAEFATNAVLAERCFPVDESVIPAELTPARIEAIAKRDPAFADELLATNNILQKAVSPRLRDDLGLESSAEKEDVATLASYVRKFGVSAPLREEPNMLRFASRFLSCLQNTEPFRPISPSDVFILPDFLTGNASANNPVQILGSRVSAENSLYALPKWCEQEECWRFQLGYLLRFILVAEADFTVTRTNSFGPNRRPAYRQARTHFYQRSYGFFNGHAAFGDDWLPVSDWLENFLFRLLAWPGCVGETAQRFALHQGVDEIEKRIAVLEKLQGERRSGPFLTFEARPPINEKSDRPLRIAVVQTVIPGDEDLETAFRSGDHTYSEQIRRRRHRNHLASALNAVASCLNLRDTHRDRGGRLDLLILPELAVHPNDVQLHLRPFAMQYRCVILAGLTYQALRGDSRYVNSALWIVPTWHPARGLQIITRRQCKKHLAPAEKALDPNEQIIRGYRPCQWLIGYQWRRNRPPLWLTASVCYDATDLQLAADLRDLSDVFVIPALNRDVATFDNMALALHYHMYQKVIVANNGGYGGSNSYWPKRDAWVRQIFHVHGQPQAAISFIELDHAELEALQNRKLPQAAGDTNSPGDWKPLPAGMR